MGPKRRFARNNVYIYMNSPSAPSRGSGNPAKQNWVPAFAGMSGVKLYKAMEPHHNPHE